MNPDGTPETELEKAVLKTGLAKILVEIGVYTPETQAQSELIAEADLSPETDPHAHAMYDVLRKCLEDDA